MKEFNEILTLQTTEDWYIAIYMGWKVIEYRDPKYLDKIPNKKYIQFINGQRKNPPKMVVEILSYSIDKRWNKLAIEMGKVISFANLPDLIFPIIWRSPWQSCLL